MNGADLKPPILLSEAERLAQQGFRSSPSACRRWKPQLGAVRSCRQDHRGEGNSCRTVKPPQL